MKWKRVFVPNFNKDAKLFQLKKRSSKTPLTESDPERNKQKVRICLQFSQQ